MKREKFTFNPRTLQYETYRTPFKGRILRSLGFGGALMLSGLCFAMILRGLFPSSGEKALRLELEQMKLRYSSLNREMGAAHASLDRLHQMDGDIRQIIFGTQPMDEGIWTGGTGGSDKYGAIARYKNTGALLVETSSKLDKLERQLALQEKSMNGLLKLARQREEYLASVPSIKPVRADQLKKDFNLMSGFGMRIHPIFKIRRMHEGLDFAASTGTPIQASGNGRVSKIEHGKGGYGNSVEIDHGYGYSSKYAHMGKITVREGQRVTKGEAIGSVGNTGTSTAPHLHYEVRIHGQPVNPVTYCIDNLSPEEYDRMVKLSAEENKSFD